MTPRKPRLRLPGGPITGLIYRFQFLFLLLFGYWVQLLDCVMVGRRFFNYTYCLASYALSPRFFCACICSIRQFWKLVTDIEPFDPLHFPPFMTTFRDSLDLEVSDK